MLPSYGFFFSNRPLLLIRHLTVLLVFEMLLCLEPVSAVWTHMQYEFVQVSASSCLFSNIVLPLLIEAL